MKPAAFSYHRATTVSDAVEALATHADDDPKVLAGGQSLVAVMNLRLARPGMLVDIGRIPGLRHVTTGDDGVLRIGALTRHADVEHHAGDLGAWELLRTASRHIGHMPIRRQGTVGGSLAHADPAAEWCLAAVLLDAEVVAVGPDTRRTIAASELFHGFLTTDLDESELLTQARFPWGPDRAGFREFSRRHGDFAVVAAGVAHDLDDDGVGHARIALGGVGTRVVRCSEAERAMEASDPSDPTAAERIARTAATEISPPSDGNADADTRRMIAATLVTRALHDAGWTAP